MRNTWLARLAVVTVLAGLVTLATTVPATSGDDEAAVKQTVKDYYAAFSSLDRERYRTFVSDDYLLLENGEILDFAGDVAAMPSPDIHPRRTDSFDFRSVKVDGPLELKCLGGRPMPHRSQHHGLADRQRATNQADLLCAGLFRLVRPDAGASSNRLCRQPVEIHITANDYAGQINGLPSFERFQNTRAIDRMEFPFRLRTTGRKFLDQRASCLTDRSFDQTGGGDFGTRCDNSPAKPDDQAPDPRVTSWTLSHGCRYTNRP